LKCIYMKKYLLLSFVLILAVLFYFSQQSKPNQILQQVAKYQSFDNPDRASFRDYIMMMDPETGKIPFEKYPLALQQANAMKSRSLESLAWTQISSNMGGRTKVICYDPNNSQVMYVGTGEHETAISNMYRESSGRGYGIWKSTDGGQSFQRLMSTVDFQYISDIVVANNAGQSVIYAGVVSGEYHGGTFQSQPSDGLYKSTDGGATWTQVLPNITGTTQPYAPSDIEVTASGRIFVGTKRNMNGNGGACILYSDTGNAGSWTVNTQYQTQISNASDSYNIPARVKLASAPSDSNKIYAFIAAKSLQETVEGYPTTIGKICVRSTDAGATWHTRHIPNNYNSGKNWAYLAWHALSVVVDPNNPDVLFAGGLDIHKSTDGGNTWQIVSDWAAMYGGGSDDYVHADIHRLAFAPGSSSFLSVCSDGGVFVSQNANNPNIVFENHNKDYATLQFYSCAISQTGNEFLLGGLQDNGSVMHFMNPFNESDMVQGGDGASCAFDKNELIYVSSTYDNAFKVQNITTNEQNYIYDYRSGLFLSTFDYDSQNNSIWAIASDMHGNRLNEVLKLTNILDYGNHQGDFIDLNTATNATFSAIRLIDSDNLFIGTIDGQFYKVNDINTTPVAHQLGAGVLPTAFLSSIQTGDNGQRILLTFSNYGVQSVWQSLNGGTTWTDVSGNLPDMPIRWAIYHPDNADKVMLATEVGVWATDNINAVNVVWTQQTSGMPNVRVDMLDMRTDNDKVVAGTHGRTMFTTIWDANSSGITDEKAVADFNIYPNPATTYVQVKSNKLGVDCSIYDLSGKLVKQEVIRKNEQSIDLSNLSAGTYLVKLGDYTKQLIITK